MSTKPFSISQSTSYTIEAKGVRYHLYIHEVNSFCHFIFIGKSFIYLTFRMPCFTNELINKQKDWTKRYQKNKTKSKTKPKQNKTKHLSWFMKKSTAKQHIGCTPKMELVYWSSISYSRWPAVYRGNRETVIYLVASVIWHWLELILYCECKMKYRKGKRSDKTHSNFWEEMLNILNRRKKSSENRTHKLHSQLSKSEAIACCSARCVVIEESMSPRRSGNLNFPFTISQSKTHERLDWQ